MPYENSSKKLIKCTGSWDSSRLSNLGVLPEYLRPLESQCAVFIEEFFVSETEKALETFSLHWDSRGAFADIFRPNQVRSQVLRTLFVADLRNLF